MPRKKRQFDVELTFAFRGSYTGYKMLPGAVRIKKQIRQALRAAGIQDHGLVDMEISERGINPPVGPRQGYKRS